MNEINARAVSDFTDDELTTFTTLLRRMVTAMERDSEEDNRIRPTDSLADEV